MLPAGSWDKALEVDQVLLVFDQRYRRRFMLPTVGGTEVLLDLPSPLRLRDGDGLVLDNGRIVRVCARAEPLLEITTSDPALLVRIAWHLGNRHLAVQFLGDRLRIHADHVIADMVNGLGGHSRPIEAAFDPEPGAYAQAGHHAHSASAQHDH